MRNRIEHPAAKNAVMMPERIAVMDTILAFQLQLFGRRRVGVADIDKASSPTAHNQPDITKLTVSHLKPALREGFRRNRVGKGNTSRHS